MNVSNRLTELVNKNTSNVSYYFPGLFGKGRCPKGRECNFLHVFKNPNKEFNLADRDMESFTPRQDPRHSWRGSRYQQRSRDRSRSPGSRSSRVRSRERSKQRRSRERNRHSRSRSRERSYRSHSRYSRHRSRSKERSRLRSPDDDRSSRRRKRSNSIDRDEYRLKVKDTSDEKCSNGIEIETSEKNKTSSEVGDKSTRKQKKAKIDMEKYYNDSLPVDTHYEWIEKTVESVKETNETIGSSSSNDGSYSDNSVKTKSRKHKKKSKRKYRDKN